LNLEVNIGKLKLKNPVVTASGTFGYGEEYAEFVDLNGLGAIAVKGISLKPMQGNPPPRICETPCGMLNSIGLQNVGLKKFLKEKLPFLRRYDTKIIVNVLGNTVNEYEKISCALDDAGVDAVELNVSCPNVKKGGIHFGTDKKMLARLVSKVKKALKNAVLITKLSPNVSDIGQLAHVAEDAGSDAVSLINTIPGLSIDIDTKRPRLRNVVGGLSGPAIKPIAVRMVYEVYNSVRIPIVGMGGIMNSDDAIEFILAGATAVAVGTANFVNPRATAEILDGMVSYMQSKNIFDIKSLRGALYVEWSDHNIDD
jgi:dihydroorotate dehydrogenase (NAD+) catalytic subunit